jgi:hypothetical protein
VVGNSIDRDSSGNLESSSARLQKGRLRVSCCDSLVSQYFTHLTSSRIYLRSAKYPRERSIQTQAAAGSGPDHWRSCVICPSSITAGHNLHVVTLISNWWDKNTLTLEKLRDGSRDALNKYQIHDYVSARTDSEWVVIREEFKKYESKVCVACLDIAQ